MCYNLGHGLKSGPPVIEHQSLKTSSIKVHNSANTNKYRALTHFYGPFRFCQLMMGQFHSQHSRLQLTLQSTTEIADLYYANYDGIV